MLSRRFPHQASVVHDKNTIQKHYLRKYLSMKYFPYKSIYCSWELHICIHIPRSRFFLLGHFSKHWGYNSWSCSPLPSTHCFRQPSSRYCVSEENFLIIVNLFTNFKYVLLVCVSAAVVLNHSVLSISMIWKEDMITWLVIFCRISSL